MLKFGGTSIGTASRIDKVIGIIKSLSKNNQLAIVVSAASSRQKSEGTTSMLINLANEALLNQDYKPNLLSLSEYQKSLVSDLKIKASSKKILLGAITRELQQLEALLAAVAVIRELTYRSSDAIVAYGEKFSSLIISACLNDIGLESEYVNFENIVNAEFKNVDIDFHHFAQARIAQRLSTILPSIPVITGFMGAIPGGIMQGIGRGYTDFTAATVAAAIKANELQIWKEVDGLFSADPSKVENAYVIEQITPAEASEISYYGAEVLHPFTIEQVVQNNIPVRIKNILAPKSHRTVIDPIHESVRRSSAKPTAVTIKRNIRLINIKSNRMLMAHGFMSKVFNIMEKHQVAIDLIATSEVSISLTVDAKYELSSMVKDLEKIGEVSISSNLSILSIVGLGMKESLGTAGLLFQTLAINKINIEMISQGASEINISCVIKSSDALQALKAVHAKMLL